MKKYILLLLLAIVSLGLSINAQNNRSKNTIDSEIRIQNTPKERAARLVKQLKLPKTLSYRLENYYAKMDLNSDIVRADMKNIGKNSDDRKTKLEAQRITDDAELRSIIGNEKMEKYIQLRIQRESKMKDRGRGKSDNF